MKKIMEVLIITVLLQACGSGNNENKTREPEQDKMNRVSWILGEWTINNPDMTIIEAWQKTSATGYSGYSISMTPKGDTIFRETIRMVSDNDTLWYLPAVSNQNNGKEVRFKEKSISDKEIVFENMAHDFPQRVGYQKTSDTTILAYIEGMQDGKIRKEEFPYCKKQ